MYFIMFSNYYKKKIRLTFDFSKNAVKVPEAFCFLFVNWLLDYAAKCKLRSLYFALSNLIVWGILKWVFRNSNAYMIIMSLNAKLVLIGRNKRFLCHK